jgi:hypothetical protein
MSASKCGNVFGVVIPIPAPKFVDRETLTFEDSESPDILLSEKETMLFRKIRALYPNWYPFTRKEIWSKAYSLGLLDG